MIGIYKITNLITGKIYIGQSVHIERRFSEHCFPSKTSIISKAIQKYGKDNFTFEVIEECSKEQLDEKERYWIQYFNSIVPNGYNVAFSTNDTTHTSYRFFDKDIVDKIIFELQKGDLSFKEISQKYNINISNVSRINKGETHKQENLIYPIRKTKQHFNSVYQNFCLDCNKPIGPSSQRCNDCENKRRREEGLKKVPVTREELKNLIRTTPFTTIGKKFNVSDNAVRKWCNKYQLPNKAREIKKFSDEAWSKI